MYLITSVTNGRRRYFDDACFAQTVVRTLRQLAERGYVDSHAFVLMPDHIHWLITLRKGTLSALVARLKGGSARQISQLLGRVGEPLWQAGFHDHALRADEEVRRIARYIVANPLRAGLVSAIGDYPWWDAQWI